MFNKDELKSIKRGTISATSTTDQERVKRGKMALLGAATWLEQELARNLLLAREEIERLQNPRLANVTLGTMFFHDEDGEARRDLSYLDPRVVDSILYINGVNVKDYELTGEFRAPDDGEWWLGVSSTTSLAKVRRGSWTAGARHILRPKPLPISPTFRNKPFHHQVLSTLSRTDTELSISEVTVRLGKEVRRRVSYAEVEGAVHCLWDLGLVERRVELDGERDRVTWTATNV